MENLLNLALCNIVVIFSMPLSMNTNWISTHLDLQGFGFISEDPLSVTVCCFNLILGVLKTVLHTVTFTFKTLF